MTDRTTAEAPDVHTASGAVRLPRLDGPGTRAWAHRIASELCPDGRPPIAGTPAWQAADDDARWAAVFAWFAARYEDDTELEERLRIEADNNHVVNLARLHEAHDQANDAVRPDRQALSKLPTLAELQARRREYPAPRPMTQAPGWPAPVIPGSGGRRLGEPDAGAA